MGSANGQVFFTIQNPLSKPMRFQGQAAGIPQTMGTQFQIVSSTDGGATIQLAPVSSSTKHVPIKPAPPQKTSNLLKMTGTSNNSLTLALPLNSLQDSTDISTLLLQSKQSKKARRKPLPPAPSPSSPTQEQVETVVIETTADNILQAGNNLVIVQSPGTGQPAVLQLVQPKTDTQLVQIPQQALRVVQAASASLPTVPQKAVQNVQSTEIVPTQVPNGHARLILY